VSKSQLGYCDVIERWPERVNGSKANADDLTLIEPIELAAA
jgi:hypothetical protein